MTDEVANVMLEHLRRIRGSQERMELDIADLKVRVSGLEQSMGAVTIAIGGSNQRLDRLEERVGRIERRLDLVDAD